MEKPQMTVGTYLRPRVPTASRTDRAGPLLDSLRGRSYDNLDAVYVTDADNRLLGTISLLDLHRMAADMPIDQRLSTDMPVVQPATDREVAASLAIQHELTSVPVVDESSHLLGVFPSGAIMHTLRAEHMEDLHHMAGILQYSDRARRALEAAPVQRVRYRLPWLLIGLAGSLLAALFVSQFEQLIERNIALAFFIPTVVYLAGAVGAQSDAVAVRGLSLTDAGIGWLVREEFATGLMLGLIIAVITGGLVGVLLGDPKLMIVVGSSLLMACALATTIGLLLPWLFGQMGWDPALASGPIATILRDVLSLLIYFAAATALMI